MKNLYKNLSSLLARKEENVRLAPATRDYFFSYQR